MYKYLSIENLLTLGFSISFGASKFHKSKINFIGTGSNIQYDFLSIFDNFPPESLCARCGSRKLIRLVKKNLHAGVRVHMYLFVCVCLVFMCVREKDGDDISGAYDILRNRR